MAGIASREPCNDAAGVLRHVEEGESLTITPHGRAVARLVPLPRGERQRMPRPEPAGDTSDDLGPVR